MAGETTQFDTYSNNAAKARTAGVVCCIDATHEIQTTELQLADKIKVGELPAGAIYLDAYLACDDLDSSTGLSLELGDSNDVDGLVDGTALGQAAAITRANGAYITNRTQVTTQTTVYLNVTAAATTAVAGTVRVVVLYWCP